MKRQFRGTGFPFLLILVVLLTVEMFGSNLLSGKGPEVEYASLLSQIRSGTVSAVLLRDDTAYALRQNSQIAADRFSTMNYDYSAVVPADFVETCLRIEAEKREKDPKELTVLDLPFRLTFLRKQTMPWYAELIPYLIMTGLMIFFLVTMMRQQGGGKMMNFGHSPARLFEAKGNPVTFKDVAGAAEEKEEMTELVEFLKNPQRFSDVGARIPKGVLLVGPPGTGKTLLARAVAGEAGVPFMTISGSDFVEMFVGVGASRVRDLFEQAKRKAPCIVFIDEIDAVGRRRGAGLGGGHDEREQTLNQLLVEMDGFAANEGVIVLAATNRKDILDPALLRPGRFDRQITVSYPDLAGREAILRVHAQGKPLENERDLYDVARRTPYSSGADLENIMNEAAILCAREGKDRITAAHLSNAVERIQMGPEKKSHAVTEEDKRLVACHEAGHAIVGELLPGCDKVHLVTIMPRGGSGGHTLLLPERESDFTTREQLLDYVAMALGGYAAEGIVLGQVSTGAASDLKRATEICRRMVTQYGMSDSLGPIWLGGEHDEVFLDMEYGQQSRGYSEDVAARIDAEVQRKLNGALQRAREILTEHRDVLDELSAMLIEKETIDRPQFEAFLRKNGLIGEAYETAENYNRRVSPAPCEKEEEKKFI